MVQSIMLSNGKGSLPNTRIIVGVMFMVIYTRKQHSD